LAFREKIEAILQAKDAQRFKTAMDKAAKSVRGLGKEGDKSSASLEALDLIEDHLATQTEQLSAVLEVLQRQLDESGDEALQMALKMAAANQVMKKSGSNAIFLGKSFAFWKDRLSITRSEILGTAYTIGAYLSPALLALGSSFTMALLGGAAVGTAGLSGLIFGLGTLGKITGQAVDDIDKIRKAQDQYNVTVDQYGAASKQASRASARLGAIIKNNGGMQAAMLLASEDRLSRQWRKGTTPARSDVFGTMSAGIGSLQSILPVVMQQVNRMASSTRRALTDAFQTLSGPETVETLKILGDLFSKSIGPGTRGVTNIIKIFFRIVRAGAPWAQKWADAWGQWTDSLVKGTSSQGKVQKFIDNAVSNFAAWWELAKSLGTTLKIVFGGFGDQGKKMVENITEVVDKFNEWLASVKNSGAIDRAFQKYVDSLNAIIWAVQHPLDAIEKYVPQMLDTVSNALVSAAPGVAEAFLTAFWGAGIWTKLITAVFLAGKFGLLGAVWKNTAGLAASGFADGFKSEMMKTKQIDKFKSAGTTVGNKFGVAFGLAAVVGIGLSLSEGLNEIDKQLAGKDTFLGKAWQQAKSMFPGLRENIWLTQQLNDLIGGEDENDPRKKLKKPKKTGGIQPTAQPSPRRGGAGGGIIPLGGSAWVGEQGPEVAENTPWGTKISPLAGNGLQPASIPNMSGALNIYLTTSVQVNRREIARAYSEEQSYLTARRGGTAP